MYIIRPLAWLFRCVAIAPFRSAVDKYIFLVIMFATVPEIVYGTVAAAGERDPIARGLLLSNKVLMLLAIFGFLVYNMLYRKSIQSILSDLKTTEDDLLAIGATPQSPTKTQLAFLSAFIISVLCRIVAKAFIKSVYTVIFEASLIIITNAILTQHLVLVTQLHLLFSALNHQLRRFSAAADDTPVDVMSSQLESVFRIHSSLHVTVSDVNVHFFVYNFMATAARFLFCVLTMYMYLVTIAEDETRLDAWTLCIFGYKTSSFIVQCVLCHACAKEANHTVLLAHHTLQPHTPFRLWKEVGDFSSLCIDNRVEFGVGGLFILNRPLITRFFVLAFSYLIVAVQLKDAHLFDDNNVVQTLNNDTVANVTIYDNFTRAYKLF